MIKKRRKLLLMKISRGKIVLNGRVYCMTPHARERLKDRFGLSELPAGARKLIKKTSLNRRIYQIGEIYIVIAKSNHRIVTVLTEKEVG